MSADLEAKPAAAWGVVDDHPVFSALASDVATRPAVSLEQVLAAAGLTTRFELKYLIALEHLPALLRRLPRELAALDIDQRRVFAYESVYFDTEDFALYRHHLQGRRKRYKARTRSYCDTRDTMFEVKLKGWRGQTVKERLPYDFNHRDQLSEEGRAFLDTVIAEALRMHTAGPAAGADHGIPSSDTCRPGAAVAADDRRRPALVRQRGQPSGRSSCPHRVQESAGTGPRGCADARWGCVPYG